MALQLRTRTWAMIYGKKVYDSANVGNVKYDGSLQPLFHIFMSSAIPTETIVQLMINLLITTRAKLLAILQH